MPIRSPDDPGPLGALSLSAPDDHIDDTGLRGLLGPLTATADELGGRLGTILGPGARSRSDPLDVRAP